MKFKAIALLGLIVGMLCLPGLVDANGGVGQRRFAPRVIRQRQFAPAYGIDCGVQQQAIYNQQDIQQVPVYQQQVIQLYNQAVPIYSYGVGQSFLPSRAFFPRRSFFPGRSFAPGFLGGGLGGAGGINLNFGDNSQNTTLGRGRLFR